MTGIQASVAQVNVCRCKISEFLITHICFALCPVCP